MEKLYEDNSFLSSFEARVVSCGKGRKGYDILLDRTAFFPEGGGQPWDTGTLGGAKVLEVHERDGQVVHTCSAPLEEGSLVRGELDWDRRFDFMQQHSGEHIVSGFAHRRWACDNVGFHLGTDVVTVDLNTVLDEADLQWLEDRVNRYLWEDHPVAVTYPTPEQLADLEYRSKKELSGRVRIVTFPGADTCACCGTHVASSGQIGLVKLLGAVRFREGVRVELVCGGRALNWLSRAARQNHHISNLLSAKVFETGSAVERLLEERDSLKLRLQQVEEQQIASLAGRCTGAGSVMLFATGLSPDSLRRFCDGVLQVCGGWCACFAGDDAHGYRYAIGCPEGENDLRPVTKNLNRTLNGRGGGRANFVQGSFSSDRKSITEALNVLQKWTILTL